MLVAWFGVADAAGRELLDVLLRALAVVHVDRAVEDHEDLGPVVDVPDVGLVGPVQPDGSAVDLCDVEEPAQTSVDFVVCEPPRD